VWIGSSGTGSVPLAQSLAGAKDAGTLDACRRQVRERVPGVNPSTVYRTLDLLEDLGVLSHAHLESGAEYHWSEEGDHIHLVCSRCGREESFSMSEADTLKQLIAKHHGFQPDLTHFAISGLCRICSAAAPDGVAAASVRA
jgi:Fur family ferric uptake transcriptional regulator